MKNFSAIVLVLAMALPCLAGFDAPLGGSGDFHFVLDAPVFRDVDGPRAELCASVRYSELRFVPAGGRYMAELDMFVKAARRGLVGADTQQRVVVYADDAADAARADRFALLELPVRLGEGRWALTVSIHDLGRSDLLGKPAVAAAQGVLEIPDRGSRQASLSDPEFRRLSGSAPLPNPERLYGVVQDTLEAYFELSDARPGQSYVIDVEVRDPIYGGMDGESLVLRPAETHSATVYRLPLGSFPDGSYRIRLTPQWSPDQSREYEFGVNWRLEQVLASVEDVEVEGSLLLLGDEYDRFRELSSAGQQALLARFWEEFDPTPLTPRNETRERFRERMAYAARHFGSYGVHGALSDRGRVYVRYGAPRDVSIEVIPLNSSDLETTIGQVHDTYQLERHGTTIKYEEPVKPSGVTQKDVQRNQHRAGSEGAYELWSYHLGGDPLLPRDRHASENLDFRFLFVDRKGNGQYVLEFSNLTTRE